MATPIPIPDSYASLPLTQVRVSHNPASFPTATKVLTVSLSRPDNHNAFTPIMERELVQVFNTISLDPRVKVAVLTGGLLAPKAGAPKGTPGPSIFCAGADLVNGFGDGQGEHPRDHRDGGGRVALAIYRCRKVVIAALNGSAVGVGITMTLPCAIRVAWDQAKVGFVFARRGIVMEACSSWFLPRLIGMSKALHLTTTGAIYPASHSLFDDLFTELVPHPTAVLPRALALADEIAENTSTVSSYLMREMMYRGADSPEGQHLLDSRVIYELFGGKDNTEGVKAFMQKRDANFQGTMEEDAPAIWPWWESVDTTQATQRKGYVFKAKGKL
ncbi:hypothetical protein B0A48_12468 [Cryoendolithus antarcticus]|uniref:Uncharacterized protein n=1 Tax=Cryoendolithus antarcticus TaxID=1507870 RepID=A0A1V8SS24_9PEZI|nr:hypothetical protein B0A48_12468 [Cryoendolithus antarcticus]